LQEIAERANRDLGAQLTALGDDFSVSVEARGENILAIVMSAENAQAEEPELIQLMTNLLSPATSLLMLDMEEDGIAEPRVLLEFLGVDGRLIGNHEFGADVEGDNLTLSEISPIDILLQNHRIFAADMQQDMGGFMTVTVAARGESAIAYVFHISEFSPENGFDEDIVINVLLPELEGAFAELLPAMVDMGVESPSIIGEFHGPDGTLLASTEVS